MKKYLNISKKKRTFVADLGIVPAVTIKYIKSMKGELIFKCFAQGEWWYVYGIDYGILGVRYRLYKGRRWYSHVDFETLRYAIATAVNAVTMGMKGCHFKVDEML